MLKPNQRYFSAGAVLKPLALHRRKGLGCAGIPGGEGGEWIHKLQFPLPLSPLRREREILSHLLHMFSSNRKKF
jgi:hypothetical protein